MTEYPYASGDLIETPNTYFYSQYQGRAFVAAWREARSAVQSDLSTPTAPPPPTRHDAASRQTADLLERALGGEHGLREAFVKKFEIHKRVHDAYDEGFRAVDRTARRSLVLYIRAADLFASIYDETHALRHLNVYLKCIDTLCAVANDLPDDLSGRLAWHLQRERRFIDDLAASHGIAQ